MSPTPLTVPEARAILLADQVLEETFEARESVGLLLGSLEQIDAWIHLVASARDRVAAYEGTRRTS